MLFEIVVTYFNFSSLKTILPLLNFKWREFITCCPLSLLITLKVIFFFFTVIIIYLLMYVHIQ